MVLHPQQAPLNVSGSGSGSGSIEASVPSAPFLRNVTCKSWLHNQTQQYRAARSHPCLHPCWKMHYMECILQHGCKHGISLDASTEVWRQLNWNQFECKFFTDPDMDMDLDLDTDMEEWRHSFIQALFMNAKWARRSPPPHTHTHTCMHYWSCWGYTLLLSAQLLWMTQHLKLGIQLPWKTFGFSQDSMSKSPVWKLLAMAFSLQMLLFTVLWVKKSEGHAVCSYLSSGCHGKQLQLCCQFW